MSIYADSVYIEEYLVLAFMERTVSTVPTLIDFFFAGQ